LNQVTELLRLVPGASIEDAIIRLSTLFDLMARAPGFQRAEVLRKTDEPDKLLVMHSWNELADWTDFRSSDTKIAFTASRPDFLYTFMPCGIDWLLQDGESTQEGDYVHREVIRDVLQPASGLDVTASQTFTYQDYEPRLEGAWLRLTRHSSAPTQPRHEDDRAVADEVYESVKKFSMDREPSIAHVHVAR
jgi:heme-degrading monooxygenase HmoA